MSKLQITGLAQETDFSDPGKTRSVVVIDNGKLRLTIRDEEIVDLLKYAVQVEQTEQPLEHQEQIEEEQERQGAESSPLSVVSGDEEDEDEEGVLRDESGIAQI